MITLKCEYCQEEFETKFSLRNKRKFCSRKCVYKWQSENFRKKTTFYYCDYCNKEIKGRSPATFKNKQYHFCNRVCFTEWRKENWKGEKAPQYRGGGKKVDCLCDYCGKTIKRFPCEVKKSKHFFCNIECRRKWHAENLVAKRAPNWQGGDIEVQCSTCGKIILRIKSKISKRKRYFCSSDCMGKWQSKYITGDNHPNWKGGWSPYYGPNWKNQRRKARKRDNFTCQNCGIIENDLAKRLDVHHKKPFREFNYIAGQNQNYKQANKMSNLISLCSSCHVKCENDKISK